MSQIYQKSQTSSPEIETINMSNEFQKFNLKFESLEESPSMVNVIVVRNEKTNTVNEQIKMAAKTMVNNNNSV